MNAVKNFKVGVASILMLIVSIKMKNMIAVNVANYLRPRDTC